MPYSFAEVHFTLHFSQFFLDFLGRGLEIFIRNHVMPFGPCNPDTICAMDLDDFNREKDWLLPYAAFQHNFTILIEHCLIFRVIFRFFG